MKTAHFKQTKQNRRLKQAQITIHVKQTTNKQTKQSPQQHKQTNTKQHAHKTNTKQ